MKLWVLRCMSHTAQENLLQWIQSLKVDLVLNLDLWLWMFWIELLSLKMIDGCRCGLVGRRREGCSGGKDTSGSAESNRSSSEDAVCFCLPHWSLASQRNSIGNTNIPLLSFYLITPFTSLPYLFVHFSLPMMSLLIFFFAKMSLLNLTVRLFRLCLSIFLDSRSVTNKLNM